LCFFFLIQPIGCHIQIKRVCYVFTSVCLSVCLSVRLFVGCLVCHQYYSKSYKQISTNGNSGVVRYVTGRLVSTVKHTGQESGGKLCKIFKLWPFLHSNL